MVIGEFIAGAIAMFSALGAVILLIGYHPKDSGGGYQPGRAQVKTEPSAKKRPVVPPAKSG